MGGTQQKALLDVLADSIRGGPGVFTYLPGQRQRLRLFETQKRALVGQKRLGMPPPHHNSSEATQANQQRRTSTKRQPAPPQGNWHRPANVFDVFRG
jgi:hypothetical protein